jgi:hypothetical protein
MAKTKSTPNLPASSRMQMPSGGGNLNSKIKETGGMKGGKGASSKVMAGAKGKGMAKKKAY